MCSAAMAPSTRASEPDPDLLRRLREFQSQVRRLPIPRRGAVVPARGTLSSDHVAILARLARLSPKLAAGLEQSLVDLNDGTRLTYVGPAGEAREVLRTAIQLLAPDEEVRKQTWFVGIKQGNKMNPSQAERTRYAVQQRRGDFDQSAEVSELIDQRIGRLARNVYQRASAAFHADEHLREVRRLLGYVFVLLDDVLPD
jgi:Predicted pPIWI-associating nuclease